MNNINVNLFSNISLQDIRHLNFELSLLDSKIIGIAIAVFLILTGLKLGVTAFLDSRWGQPELEFRNLTLRRLTLQLKQKTDQIKQKNTTLRKKITTLSS